MVCYCSIDAHHTKVLVVMASVTSWGKSLPTAPNTICTCLTKELSLKFWLSKDKKERIFVYTLESEEASKYYTEMSAVVFCSRSSPFQLKD